MARPIAAASLPPILHNHRPDASTLRDLRVDLAACFRLAARHGLQDGICNHFSAVVPDRPDLFLVNPYGLAFAEITASSLLLCDFEGNGLEGDGRRSCSSHQTITFTLANWDHPSITGGPSGTSTRFVRQRT